MNGRLGRALLPLLTVAFLPSAWSGMDPPRGSVDPRVRVVAYNPEDVVRLHGYVGYQIHIEWAPGEEFVNLGAGDVGGIDVGAEKNHFFIKPRQEKVNTNLTVLTTQHTYHFDYAVSRLRPRAALPDDLVYSIRFTYPQDDAARLATDAERRATEARLARDVSDRPHNLDYAYCGTPALKPLSAYDDGVQTHLHFGARAEFPAIFVENDDHSESLLNFHVEEDEVVIHRVARRLVLRRGQLVGCVVNQAYEGGGERMKSNTAVDGVQRETRGVNP